MIFGLLTGLILAFVFSLATTIACIVFGTLIYVEVKRITVSLFLNLNVFKILLCFIKLIN